MGRKSRRRSCCGSCCKFCRRSTADSFADPTASLAANPFANPGASPAAGPSRTLPRISPRRVLPAQDAPSRDQLARRMFHVKHSFAANGPANRLSANPSIARTAPVRPRLAPPAPIRPQPEPSGRQARSKRLTRRPRSEPQTAEPPSANLASDGSYHKLTPSSKQVELA